MNKERYQSEDLGFSREAFITEGTGLYHALPVYYSFGERYTQEHRRRVNSESLKILDERFGTLVDDVPFTVSAQRALKGVFHDVGIKGRMNPQGRGLSAEEESLRDVFLMDNDVEMNDLEWLVVSEMILYKYTFKQFVDWTLLYLGSGIGEDVPVPNESNPAYLRKVLDTWKAEFKERYGIDIPPEAEHDTEDIVDDEEE